MKVLDNMRGTWGDPPWHREAFSTSPRNVSAPEVVVIGGGLTGLSAAYYLARRGVPVVLYEAGEIGDGASGRTGGIVLEGTAAGILKGSSGCVRGLEELIRRESIRCGLVLEGCWELAHRRNGRGNSLPWSDGGAGPLRVVRTVPGGTVDPTALLIGLARAAERAGAVIHQHTPVRRITLGRRPAVEVGEAALRPKFAIVAINAWTGSLLTGVRPIWSALTYAVATEPLGRATIQEIGLGAGFPFYTLDLPYLWGRGLEDGGFIFGSGLTFAPSRDLRRVGIGAEEPGKMIEHLETRVRNLHPALGEVRFRTRWAGPIAIPESRVPLIGRLPAAPQVLVAGGYGGHGVALSVRAGELLSRAIAEDLPLPSWGSPSPSDLPSVSSEG